HEGRLVFTRSSRSSDLPAEVTVPISLTVTSGFFGNWFVLRNWLIVLAGVLGLLYFFCLLVFAPPSGVLTFLVHRGGYSRKRSVPLKTTRIGRIFPWRRSTLSLARLAKQANVPV